MSAPIPKPKPRVLIVDDNLDIVQSMAVLLRERGYTVDFAINGIAALYVAQRFRPEVVLMDVGLPDTDGIDLARQMRFNPDLKDARVIAITGRGEEHRERAFKAGCAAYLVKPLDPRVLDTLLEPPPAGTLPS